MEARAGAQYIVEKLVNKGFIAYFAGGWVRDYVMGHPSVDIDIATDAPPELLLDLFPRTILVGISFGVVVVVLDGHQYEVTSFRRDISYSNGRKPDEIARGTPEEDAERRDFTINGMFFDPITEQIFDFVGGLADLKLGIVRSIGNAYDRFVEDRLRMVRAVRFATRFGFIIEEQTRHAIVANAYSLFPAVAIERIWQELTKMAVGPQFEGAIIDLHQLGLLQEIFPELASVHLHEIRRRVKSYANFPENCPAILYIAELFPAAGLPELLEVCRRLKGPTSNDKLITLLMEGRKLSEEPLAEFLALWAHYYAQPLHEICLQVIAARYGVQERQEFIVQHARRYLLLKPHIERITAKRPLVTAAMLQRRGISPGPLMGSLIKKAETIAIEKDLHDASQILAFLHIGHHAPNL